MPQALSVPGASSAPPSIDAPQYGAPSTTIPPASSQQPFEAPNRGSYAFHPDLPPGPSLQAYPQWNDPSNGVTYADTHSYPLDMSQSRSPQAPPDTQMSRGGALVPYSQTSSDNRGQMSNQLTQVPSHAAGPSMGVPGAFAPAHFGFPGQNHLFRDPFTSMLGPLLGELSMAGSQLWKDPQHDLMSLFSGEGLNGGYGPSSSNTHQGFLTREQGDEMTQALHTTMRDDFKAPRPWSSTPGLWDASFAPTGALGTFRDLISRCPDSTNKADVLSMSGRDMFDAMDHQFTERSDGTGWCEIGTGKDGTQLQGWEFGNSVWGTDEGGVASLQTVGDGSSCKIMKFTSITPIGPMAGGPFSRLGASGILPSQSEIAQSD